MKAQLLLCQPKKEWTRSLKRVNSVFSGEFQIYAKPLRTSDSEVADFSSFFQFFSLSFVWGWKNRSEACSRLKVWLHKSKGCRARQLTPQPLTITWKQPRILSALIRLDCCRFLTSLTPPNTLSVSFISCIFFSALFFSFCFFFN